MTAPPFADQAIKGLYAYKITHSPLTVQCAIFFNRILDKLIFPVLNNISSLLDNRTPAAHYRTCTFPLLSGPDPHG